MKTGIAHLPLHYGKAPPWLFQRMKNLPVNGRSLALRCKEKAERGRNQRSEHLEFAFAMKRYEEGQGRDIVE